MHTHIRLFAESRPWVNLIKLRYWAIESLTDLIVFLFILVAVPGRVLIRGEGTSATPLPKAEKH